jgi:hypothetical protein
MPRYAVHTMTLLARGNFSAIASSRWLSRENPGGTDNILDALPDTPSVIAQGPSLGRFGGSTNLPILQILPHLKYYPVNSQLQCSCATVWILISYQLGSLGKPSNWRSMALDS